MQISFENYDIIIVGGGAGGIGAAISAAEFSSPDTKILLVEKEPILGGSMTICGVHNWEPVLTNGKWHRIIATRLLELGEGCVGKSIRNTSGKQASVAPSFSVPCDDDYESTLSFLKNENIRRFHFEPLSMDKVIRDLINEYSAITVLDNTKFIKCKKDRQNIKSVRLLKENHDFEVKGKLFIDSTGDISLARSAGCPFRLGREGRSEFGEPSAPEKADRELNAATLVFRITPKKGEVGIDPIPSPYTDIDVSAWADRNFPVNNPYPWMTQYPNGDFCVNMLPTIYGRELFKMDEETGYKICLARVYRYFEWLQKYKGFDGYRIQSVSPRIGIRESYRLEAKHILNECEIRMPFMRQLLQDEIIAWLDFPIDIHEINENEKGMDISLDHPFGVPYSCLLPREGADNLLVACKGAGFSHIAAGACRIIRPVMAFGEAAGAAAAICIKDGIVPGEVNPKELREKLSLVEFENSHSMRLFL
jgi:hypothetical protein